MREGETKCKDGIYRLNKHIWGENKRGVDGRGRGVENKEERPEISVYAINIWIITIMEIMNIIHFRHFTSSSFILPNFILLFFILSLSLKGL